MIHLSKCKLEIQCIILHSFVFGSVESSRALTHMERILFPTPNEAELARKAGLEEDESRWRGVGTEINVGSI